MKSVASVMGVDDFKPAQLCDLEKNSVQKELLQIDEVCVFVPLLVWKCVL